jgi:hypothetical protein
VLAHQIGDGLVLRRKAEEALVAQSRHYPALDQQDRLLHPGLRRGRLLALSRGL